jgi:hypothetical protein
MLALLTALVAPNLFALAYRMLRGRSKPARRPRHPP